METPKNQHHRDVHVISSRKPTQVIKLTADTPICEIDALRAVADSLPAPEPGESRQIKTFFGGSN